MTNHASKRTRVTFNQSLSRSSGFWISDDEEDERKD
jgi:hypothetical protein